MAAANLDDFETKNVRKWGSKILAVAPMSTTVPEKFFDATAHTLLAIPTGWFSLGGISTDGVKETTSVDSDTVMIDQSLTPARQDMTGKTKTLQGTLMEVNAWTHALRAGTPLEEWPTEKDGAFEIFEGDLAAYPYMRILILAQDGVGQDARYRVECATRAQVSKLGDRTIARSTPEQLDTTWTLFQDPEDEKRRSWFMREDGPAYATHLTEAGSGN